MGKLSISCLPVPSQVFSFETKRLPELWQFQAQPPEREPRAPGVRVFTIEVNRQQEEDTKEDYAQRDRGF